MGPTSIRLDVRLANALLKDEESHVLACNFAEYLPKQKITDILSKKPFIIWLLTTLRTHLKYAAAVYR